MLLFVVASLLSQRNTLQTENLDRKAQSSQGLQRQSFKMLGSCSISCPPLEPFMLFWRRIRRRVMWPCCTGKVGNRFIFSVPCALEYGVILSCTQRPTECAGICYDSVWHTWQKPDNNLICWIKSVCAGLEQTPANPVDQDWKSVLEGSKHSDSIMTTVTMQKSVKGTWNKGLFWLDQLDCCQLILILPAKLTGNTFSFTAKTWEIVTGERRVTTGSTGRSKKLAL